MSRSRSSKSPVAVPWLSRRRLLTGLGVVLVLRGTAGAMREDAAALAQAVFDRATGRDLTTVGRMELVENGRAPRLRKLVTYRLNKGGGETAILVRFVAPEDIAGTGLLSVDKPDGSNEQWLYLPALDRVRRVAGDRKGGRFVGSDIYFEDLQERKPSRDTHRLLGREAIDGVTCEILESTAIDRSDSVYRKRVSWVDATTAVVHRVDYFEKSEQSPSKRWTLLAKRQIQGYWTVTESLLTDLTTGHQTRMTAEKTVYDRKLPAKLLSTHFLADESIESEYRP